MTQIKTCGFFIVNTNKQVVIAHPTNSRWSDYSIPKGLMEPGETEFDTAVRELWEETNIDLHHLTIEDVIVLPPTLYRNCKRMLCTFLYYAEDTLNDVELKCHSYVDGQDFLENDKIIWKPISKCYGLLHEAQTRLLPKVETILEDKY